MQPLKEQITAFLEASEVKFEFEEEDNIFRFGFDTENTTIHVAIRYDDERRVMLNNAWIAINLPKERKTNILYAINKTHDDYNWPAYLYLDEEDNGLMAKCVIDVPEAGVDQEVFDSFVNSTVSLLDYHFKNFMAIAYGQGTEKVPEEDTEAEVGGEESNE